jgi:hypothetical protein
MSECGVCVGDFDGEGFEFSTKTYPVARKEHRCHECLKTIVPGQKYERVVGAFDGSIETYKTCLVCAEIIDAFSCNGRTFGGFFWSDLFDDDCWKAVTTGCLNKLETPEAKAEFQRRWMEWKGLAA